jgi:hypothetical protein
MEGYTVNEQWERSGAKVAVYLRNQEALVAWLVHEEPTKLILSLDPERHNLRTIFRRDIVQLQIDPNEQAWIEPAVGAERLRRLREFEPTLVGEIEPNLDRVDYGRLRRNAKVLKRIAMQGEPPQERLDERFPPESQVRPLVPAQDLYETLTLSLDLVEELERTRLLGVISDHTRVLQELVHEETLPAFDAEWAGPQEVYNLVEFAQKGDGELIESREMLREARDKVWSRKDTARWVDGAGDIVLGASLASANVAAGAIVGIVGMLPTLGIGTVAAALGVTTSAFTGLTTLKKGVVALIKGDG